MNTQTETEKYWGTVAVVIALLFAVWLVSPFIKIDRSDYAERNVLGYRLALGLLIMILLVGKWAFDSLAPQGLARKVSNAKAIALIALSLLIMGFIVFVVAQATVLYLKTAAQETQQQTTIDQ
jgi:heme/copper-type cytochrome/quinol oxidase subunit 2